MPQPLDWTFNAATGEVRRESRVIGVFFPDTASFTYATQDDKDKYRAKVPKVLKENNFPLVLKYDVAASPAAG